MSFGATMKFIIRGPKQTRGWINEYELEDGMLVWMKAGAIKNDISMKYLNKRKLRNG